MRKSKKDVGKRLKTSKPVTTEPLGGSSADPTVPPQRGSKVRGRKQRTATPTSKTQGTATKTTDSPSVVAATPAVKPLPPATVPHSGGLAAKLKSRSNGEQDSSESPTIPEIVAGYTPTGEQREGLSLAAELFSHKGSQRVLVLVAGAGAGKTSELKMIESVLVGNGQYTAFNKSLVEDSRPKFKAARVNTTHSLAFRDVGRRFSHRLGGARIRSDQVATQLGIGGLDVITGVMEDGSPRIKCLKPSFLAGQIIVAIRSFCQSADPTITVKHFRYIDGIDSPSPTDGKRTHSNNEMVKGALLPFAVKAWADLSSEKGTLPFQHDVYVKLWQLGVGGAPFIPADYILLDEYQDTAPVFVDILKQQTHALLVLVGDDNQRIYEWRGAINAGDEFPDAPRSMLSQSFRFGQTIADVANTVLGTLQEPTELRMKGNPAIPSRVGSLSNPRCILCRTNAGALGYVLRAVDSGKRPHLIGGSKEVVAFVRAARDLQDKKSTDHPELACFSSWKEVQEYSRLDEGEDLRLMVKLIDDFGADKILLALEDMPEESEADMVVSTAHKSKGREWPTVKLAEDFPLANRMGDSDARLLYVALTRAQEQLDISTCPPFCGGKDRGQTGNPERESIDVPGLEIRYTVPMPTEAELEEYRKSKGEESTPIPSDNGNPSRPTTTTEAPRQHPANVEPSEGFTWAKYGDRWGIRGPKDAKQGETVTVVRRNGSTSRERIGQVLARYDDAWIYAAN